MWKYTAFLGNLISESDCNLNKSCHPRSPDIIKYCNSQRVLQRRSFCRSIRVEVFKFIELSLFQILVFALSSSNAKIVRSTLWPDDGMTCVKGPAVSGSKASVVWFRRGLNCNGMIIIIIIIVLVKRSPLPYIYLLKPFPFYVFKRHTTGVFGRVLCRNRTDYNQTACHSTPGIGGIRELLL